MDKKFYKTDYNKMVSGVCNGLAEYFDMDVSIIRVVFALFIFFGVGSPIIFYIILAIILPTKLY